uniref:ScyR1 n=1 Tax=Scytalidium album TaxID=1525810 RepID=A0A8A5D779_9PEZI|nr:ScyR1 [Scytalidium album]
MPAMRFLCLHGAGTNGEIESLPGPGVEGFYEAPFLSYYKWPRTFHDDEQSIMEAYDLLYETIEEDGPFDGIIGFSHGGALATGFMAHHAAKNPYDSPLFQCAIFFNSMPPFRMDDEQNPIFEKGLEGKIRIPTLHVMGTKDFAYKYSVNLYNLCDSKSSSIVLHDKGHEIPRDGKAVSKIAAAIRDLGSRSMFH